MSQYVTVRDKRTGLVREVTKRAYQLKQKDYVLVVGDQPKTVPNQPVSVKVAVAAEEERQPVEVTAKGEDIVNAIDQKQKRHRRTKAEMEAARAAEGVENEG